MCTGLFCCLGQKSLHSHAKAVTETIYIIAARRITVWLLTHNLARNQKFTSMWCRKDVVAVNTIRCAHLTRAYSFREPVCLPAQCSDCQVHIGFIVVLEDGRM